MKLAILKETAKDEARVAATPDSVKRLIALGAKVAVQSGAGGNSGMADALYKEAGATIAKGPADLLKAADVVLCVAPPGKDVLERIPEQACLIGMLNPHGSRDLAAYAAQGIAAFSLELLPRISRAQAMDVLSSQSNLAGYRAVIEGFAESAKVVPMMMTAAGTIPPAKVLILGAGVAGLQAVATAKRLGAVVSVFDVRPAVKEQVESLGGKFIEVPPDEDEAAETSGGYAKEMSEDYKRRQSELIFETVAKQDLVITTALIPGRPAPVLIPEEMVEAMKPGAVVVDLAAINGGNCALTKPDKVVTHKGVRIIGHTNLPSLCAVDASALYARNLYNFVSTLLMNDGALDVQWEDELVAGTLLSRDGEMVHESFGKETTGEQKTTQ